MPGCVFSVKGYFRRFQKSTAFLPTGRIRISVHSRCDASRCAVARLTFVLKAPQRPRSPATTTTMTRFSSRIASRGWETSPACAVTEASTSERSLAYGRAPMTRS